MKDLSDLPSVSRILFKGGVEILRFKYARPWPDEPGLNDNVPGVGDNQHGGKGLENPFEEDEGLKIR